MVILLFVCLVFLVCIQGGFYAQSYIVCGIACCIGCMIKQKKAVLSYEVIILAVIAAMYLISVMANGISYSSLSSGLLTAVMLMIAIIHGFLCGEEKSKLISCIAIFGVISSIVAIILYTDVIHTVGAVSNGRLAFTFQYANAAGVWFAVSFLLSFFSEIKYIRYLSVFCFFALVVTKSAGALIVLSVLFSVHLFKSGYYKRAGKRGRAGILTVYITEILVALIVIIMRGSSILYTFAERFIHCYDGFKVIKESPLCGIGASEWQYVFPYYQSVQYSANVIHNSYVQAGVDAGIIVMALLTALLILSIYKYFKNENIAELCAVYILMHSVVDYDLRFSSLYMLLVIFMTYKPYQVKRVYINKKVVSGISLALSLALCFSMYGVNQVKALENGVKNGNQRSVEKIFDKNHMFMKNGYRENEALGTVLCFNGQDISGIRKKSARLAMYEVITKESCSIDEVIALVNSQPYNTVVLEETKSLIIQNYTDKEKEKYGKCIAGINETLYKWPASLLNNQKEY